jgi:hypothetical protein
MTKTSKTKLAILVVLLVSITMAFAAGVEPRPVSQPRGQVPIPGLTGEYWGALLDAEPGPLLPHRPAGERSVRESILREMNKQ